LAAILLDEARDVDAHRAAPHAGLVGAVQAALGFDQRILEPVAAGHLVEVLDARLRVLLGHGRARLRDGADRLLLGHGVDASRSLGARRSVFVPCATTQAAAFLPAFQRAFSVGL
jgi:hypothetical protein